MTSSQPTHHRSSAELSRSRHSLEKQGGPWRQTDWAPTSVDGSTLLGKRVLVDCPHPATAVQVVQMCEALGMQPKVGSCAEEPPGTCTMAIVLAEHVAPVLRGTWRSLPIVALGAKVGVALVLDLIFDLSRAVVVLQQHCVVSPTRGECCDQ